MKINDSVSTQSRFGYRFTQLPKFGEMTGRSALALKTLANRLGVQDGYFDITGKWQQSDPENIKSVVEKLLDQKVSEPVRVLKQYLASEYSQVLPPVMVVKQSELLRQEFKIPLHAKEPFDENSEIKLKLTYENHPDSKTLAGKVEEQSIRLKNHIPDEERMVGDEVYSRYHLELPEALKKSIPLGYHQLSVGLSNGQKADMRFIIVPDKAYQPAWLEKGNKTWGPAVQVYALKHQNDWGIGDFTALAHLRSWGEKVGMGFIGVSPVHAKNFENPEQACPYVPITRQYLNPLLLDVSKVPGYDQWLKELPEKKRTEHLSHIKELRELPEIDYTAVYREKRKVLVDLYERFLDKEVAHNTPLAKAFSGFVHEQGDQLKKFSTFQALQNQFDAKGWMDWPKEYQNPNGEAVQAFERDHRKKVEFYSFMQWLCNQQLKEVAGSKENSKGLPLGLYQDLAIGSETAGFDTWVDPALYPKSAMGLPPDAMAPQGQNWSFPIPSPLTLKQRGYQPFINVLRSNMKYAKALRIDHFHGMGRYFWIPEGKTPQDAIYIKNPLKDLLGVIALESHRNKCIVIGEDLGIAPEGFDQAVKPWNIFQYKIGRWERNYQDEKNGKPFTPPADYESNAIALHSTQDTSTIRGMFNGWFWKTLKGLGLMTDAEVQNNLAQDKEALYAKVKVLQKEGLLDKKTPVKTYAEQFNKAVNEDNNPHFKTLTEAMHGFLAKTKSKLAAFLFEDIIGMQEQVNVPGVADGPQMSADPKNRRYPSWRKRLSVDIEQLVNHPWLDAVVKAFKKERPPIKTT